MNITELVPSFHDFYTYINKTYFKQEDIDFQKEKALSVGYSSWEEYLKYQYHRIIHLFDINTIADELAKNFDTNKSIKGNIPMLLNENVDESFDEELQPIYDRVNAYPEEIKERLGRFENQLPKIMMILLLHKHKDDEQQMDFVNGILKDLEIQQSFINPDQNAEPISVINYMNSLSLPNANNVIKKQITTNYYFPNKAHILKNLHDKLVRIEYIEPNEDFEKSFNSKTKSQNVKATLWLTDTTKLFYLLYRLNNKKEYVDGVSIDEISNQLFEFREPKEKRVIRTNFTKALLKFDDETYILKKMSEIENILKDLSI